MTIPPGQQPPQMTQRTQRPPEQAASQPEGTQGKQGQRPPAAEEKSSVTHHSARIGGQEIKYTATAATYNIKADDGTVKATMFYVAYTKEGVSDIAKRPLSFVYNGGPGSASLFTHMGMGPKRVVLTADGHGMPAPYTVVDNEDSFLDATDLVFIDAISTGFSRPAPGEAPNQFHGIIADANWFADFIYQYITRTERWASPKFLIGESYGTTRSAELAGVLQERHQIYLSGIALLSSVAFSNWGADNRSEFFLPTYATTAWYHHLLSSDLQILTIDQVAQQAREFAHGEYAAALEKGDALSPAERQKVVQDLARFTGLTPKYIEQTNLRISSFRWFKELERDKRRTIGRLDSRFEGMDVDAAGERVEYDPSEASYEGAFVATFHDYVRRETQVGQRHVLHGERECTAVGPDWQHGSCGSFARGHDPANFSESAGPLWLLRRRHTVQRHREHFCAHAPRAARVEKRQLHLLRGRTHDVHRREGASQATQRRR
jgi:carboxypeptidase C (cathepsin A)